MFCNNVTVASMKISNYETGASMKNNDSVTVYSMLHIYS